MEEATFIAPEGPGSKGYINIIAHGCINVYEGWIVKQGNLWFQREVIGDFLTAKY